MQVHKIEIMVIDFDEVGAEGIKEVLENTRYPNRCIDPCVKSIKSVEIGEWDDDHLLNHHATADAEYQRLFAEPYCEWKEDVNSPWDSACGQSFSLEDGGPADNGMVYCCFCGKMIRETSFDWDA